MAWYIAIHDHDNPVTQHGLASYVTKFESQSFRLRSKVGVAFAPAVSSQQSAVSSQRLRRSQSQGARGGPDSGIFSGAGKYTAVLCICKLLH